MVGCEGISERIDGIEAGDFRSEGCICGSKFVCITLSTIVWLPYHEVF